MLLRPAAWWIILIGVALPACAAGSADDPVQPPSDAGLADSAHPSDAASEHETQPEASSGSDALAEAGAQGTLEPLCPGEPSQDPPCTTGQRQERWCGRCGQQARTCGAADQWTAWGECIESAIVECAPCSVAEVSCAHCGTRAMRCAYVGGGCRWIVGVCDGAGECNAGELSYSQSDCAAGQGRLRACSEACTWGQEQACAPPAAWSSIEPGPLSPRTDMVRAVLGDRIVLWGGLSIDGQYLGDGALLDPASQVWTELPPSPIASRARASAVVLSGGLWVWGGMGEQGALQDGALFSPELGWEPLAAEGAPSKRLDAPAVWAEGAKAVVLWGGRSAYGTAASQGARYDLENGAWLPMSQAPFASRLGSSLVVNPLDGTVIVWGGALQDSGPAERTGALYDPAADSWTPIADAPMGRKGHLAIWDAARGRMLVFFGEDGVWDGPRSDGLAYEPSTGAWRLIPDLSLTGYLLSRGFAAAWDGETFWATGGDGAGYGEASPQGARYEPSIDAWVGLPPMHRGRRGHALLAWQGLIAWGAEAGGGERLGP